MKIQYLDCDGGGIKIAAKKNQTMTFLIFLALFSPPIEGPAMMAMKRCDGERVVCRWLSNKNRNQKNQTDVFDFFDHDFHHPISPINSFENLKISKLFDEDTISQIRGSCDCDG